MENNKHNEEYNNLQNKIKERKYEKRRKLDFEDGEKSVGMLDKIVSIINTHGMGKLIQAFFVFILMIFSIALYNAVDNTDLLEQLLYDKTTAHTIGSDIRIDIQPKISKTMTHMLYQTNSDRVSIIEMHNGKENPTNLPFLYCDMTYEETRDRIPLIADEYENMNMSKYMFPSYIYEHRFFIGSIEEIYDLDKKLALRLDGNDVKYVGIILVRTSVDIGFLMVSYQGVPTLTRDEIYAHLSYYAQEIGTYLDYEKQKEIKDKKSLWK